MGDEQRHTAKVQMMVLMQAGHPWQEAASRAGIHPSRSTAYRWFQHFRARGEAALQDGRHGHVHKVHDPVLQWLYATCQATPHVSSAHLQHELHEQMGAQVSITHLNRLRAAHGLTRQGGRAGEKSWPSMYRLNQGGKKGPEDCCWSLLPTRQDSLPAWKQPWLPVLLTRRSD